MIGILKGDPDKQSIILNGHVDVVSPEPVADWRYDSGGGDVGNNQLYGRGACDTKGSGAAMLWALKDYAAQPSAAANNIAIVYTVDEEVTVTGSRTFVKDHLPALAPYINMWCDLAGAVSDFRAVGDCVVVVSPAAAGLHCDRWR